MYLKNKKDKLVSCFKNIKPSKLILTIVMFAIGLLMLMPLLWMISASFKKPIEVFEYPIHWIPNEFMFQNYKEVWLNKYYPFYKFYLNSIKVVVLSIVGTLFISSTSGYAFARLNFKGKNIIFMLYLATLMIPQQSTLVPRFILFQYLNIYDTHWAIILPATFNVIGIFLMRQFYVSIPMSLSEAAKIDGAGHLTIWYRIILPLTKPAIISLIILSFTANWNDYINPLVFLTSVEKYTIPVGLQALMDDEGINYNLFMAGAACATLPLIIVFLACQKYFIEGVARSGIKG